MQHTALGFAQAAERRQHSASDVSPRNRPREATSRRAATDNATTSCSSFNRTLPLLRSYQMRDLTNAWLTPAAKCCPCSAAYTDDAVVGLAATRSLSADGTDRHHTAEVAVSCLLTSQIGIPFRDDSLRANR
jgi:hypothetical protein